MGWHAGTTRAPAQTRDSGKSRGPTSKRGAGDPCAADAVAARVYRRHRDGDGPGRRGRRPGRHRGRDHGGAARASVVLRRQGALPARQDVRRRLDDPGAAPARGPRAVRAPRSRLPDMSRCTRACIVSPSGRRVHAPAPRRRRPRRRRRPGRSRRRARRRCRAATAWTSAKATASTKLVVAADERRRCTRASGDDVRTRAISSRPTATGRRCAACSIPTRPATSARGTRSASTSTDVDDARLWVLFDRRPAPRIRVGVPDAGRWRQRRLRRVAAEGRTGRDLKALWPDLLARPMLRDILGPNAVAREPVRAWPIPTRVLARRA